MYKKFTSTQIKEFEADIDNFKKNYNDIFNNTVPVDIIAICNKLGFKILSLSLPDGFDGVILLHSDTKKIGINNKLEPRLARFVVAHELSHYIEQLKRNGMEEKKLLFAAKDRILHNDQKSDLEHRMDYMAAALLLPKEVFKKDMRIFSVKQSTNLDDITKNTDNLILEALSNRYDVNKDTIIRRIHEVSDYEECNTRQ